ncbi:MAG: DUF3106 domain-containing protein [Burkholderiaceae bacterium]|nr:DUF3106 domain-containing protein [Burkholderiaceae bacterium]
MPAPTPGLSRRLRLQAWVVIGIVLALSAPVGAQPQPSPVKRPPIQSAGPSWQSLTPQQRAALAPLQKDWSSIDDSRKAKWLDIAARYPKLPPSEQQRLHARMSEWAQMTPSERGRARLNYREAKQLPNQERQDKWQAYQALPEEQRRALATRGKSAPPPKAPPSRAKPPPELSAKRNIVPNPSHSAGPMRPVAPTVVQSSPGATTTLVTRQPAPPAHQQAGMPKITATPGFVDRNTLLPKRGPQGAGVRSAASAPAARP